MRWVNELIDRHGRDHWCIYADADEALIFPDCEDLTLHDLVGYLEARGFEAMLAPMLDMFPENRDRPEGTLAFERMQAAYRFLDNDLRYYGHPICPYKEIYGGVRRRLTGGFQLMNKVPLISGRAGIRFLMSSHQITPAKIADVTGAMLHYHMLYAMQPEFEATFHDWLNRREIPSHAMERLRCRNLLSALSAGQNLKGADSLELESTAALVEAGLLSVGPEYLAFLSGKKSQCNC